MNKLDQAVQKLMQQVADRLETNQSIADYHKSLKNKVDKPDK